MTAPPVESDTQARWRGIRHESGARRWRISRHRGVVLVVVLVLVLSAVAILGQQGREGRLDPAATGPEGARAVAELLRARGVAVERVTTAAEALARADAQSLVLIARPALLTAAEASRLTDLPVGSSLVVLGADGSAADLVHTLTGGVVGVAGTASVGPREPVCPLPAARTAGVVHLGGAVYAIDDQAQPVDAARCYAAGGSPTLVELTADGRTVTLLGSGALLTNERLDEEGNAALALSLLGSESEVLWLLPRPELGAADQDEASGLLELLPESLLWAVLQLAVALGVVALWRGRRLGPVVVEPLPVAVRAAEAVEGRARLYRAAGAHGRAAEALRTGARARLVPALGLPPDVGPEALAHEVAQRAGRTSETVSGLLYGAEPADDPALVRLARDLDALVRDTLDWKVRRP